jgi:hypothetical protein
MKKVGFLVMALTAMTVTSCSKEDLSAGGDNSEGSNSYISISVQAPVDSDLKSRANGADEAASTAAEKAITKVIYYGFDKDNVCLNAGEVTGMTVTETGGTPTKSNAIAVSSKVEQIFVVVNPTAAMINGTGAAKGLPFATVNAAVTGITSSAEYADATDMMMTNSEGLVAITPSTDANPAGTPVTVDRVVSKVTSAAFTATPGTNVPAGAAVVVTGFALNTTNKSMFPYAEYITYGAQTASYRVDANFTAAIEGIAALDAAFGWLTNATAPAVFTADAKYCLENTVSAAATNNNNITSMMIKATYFPATFPTSESWFTYQGVAYTFAGLKAAYTALADKTAFDAFMTTLDVTNKFDTYADLDAFEVALGANNTAYAFAKISSPTLILRYFKEGVCYYSVPLNHDNSVTGDNTLGRWGVVRNNSYAVTIDKIMNPGLPFIPDPTDPDITDPANPDPLEPETPDEIEANISVSITMNKWSSWTQNVEL